MPIAIARLTHTFHLAAACAGLALLNTAPVSAQGAEAAEATIAAASSPDVVEGDGYEAQSFTEALIGDLSTIAATADLTDSQRETRFEETLLEALSVEAMAMFALGGDNWENASPEQLDSYLELFPAYITRVFAAKIGLLADRQIQVQDVRERPTPGALRTILARSSERVTGDALADDDPRLASLTSVLSQVIGSDGRPKADVQWLLEQSNDTPLVFDVVAEGTSSLFVEREKISSIAAREGLDSLLAAMQRHIEEGRGT